MNSLQLDRDLPRVDNTAGYWTHIAPLTSAVLHTSGPILELGCGDYSTPLMHELCRIHQRPILTCDSNESWLTLFRDLECDWHRFVHAQDWDNITGSYGLVFIDHDTERRVQDLKRFRNTSRVFVVHDAEKRRWYKYGTLFDTFPYSYYYSRYRKQTVVLSDTVDVKRFFD